MSEAKKREKLALLIESSDTIRTRNATHSLSHITTKRHMRFATDTSFIIVGVTSDGKRFRPSDWAERLCGVLSAFGSTKKMAYSPYVSPGHCENEKAVFVDGQLYDAEPMAYRFILNFAQDNDLKLVAATCPITAPTEKAGE